MRHLLPILLAMAMGMTAYAQTESTPDSTMSDGIVRVLAIGNSFSQDAVEQYLYELADEAGVKMVIGNAYRGGQGFHSHWVDVTEQNNTFEYRKVVDGIRGNTPHMALSDIITDEPWDFITFQQVSQESGLTTTFEPDMSNLIGYTDSLKTNPGVRYGYHMTWAYSHDSTHGGFANYGNSQEVMYDSIRHAVLWAMQQHPELTFMVPSGTAIQNARTTYLGDNMNRDGYHLDLKMGRYTASCAWLETILGINPEGLSYRPEGVDPLAARICQKAAHAAAQRPDTVTVMADEGFAQRNDIVPSGLIKLNFGATPSMDSAWNSITPNQRTHTWITDTQLNPTGIVVTCTDDFSGTNTNGPTFTSTEMLMPQDVSQSCVWGYAAGHFGNVGANPTGAYTLSHMNPDLEYDITIFGSRDKCKDLRETTFLIQGDGTYSGSLDAAGNASQTVYIRNARPTPDGRLSIMAMPGVRNSHVNKFYYLNAIMLKAHK